MEATEGLYQVGNYIHWAIAKEEADTPEIVILLLEASEELADSVDIAAEGEGGSEPNVDDRGDLEIGRVLPYREPPQKVRRYVLMPIWRLKIQTHTMNAKRSQHLLELKGEKDEAGESLARKKRGNIEDDVV